VTRVLVLGCRLCVLSYGLYIGRPVPRVIQVDLVDAASVVDISWGVKAVLWGLLFGLRFLGLA
jgi:hypothetical protein